MERPRALPVAGAMLVLVLAVLAAFRPALDAGFQELWDDNANVTQNGFFRGLDGEHLAWMFTTFRMGHWQPLAWISLALDNAAWGLDPFGYHLTNVVLHAVGAVLFFFLARAVLRAAGSPAADRVVPSLIAALLFAVHPLRVESVAWITERRDVLTTPFLLLTLLAWLAWARTGERRWYALAIAAYVPALLAKAWGITLPVVLLLLDVWPLARLRAAGWRRLVAEKLPFAALAALAAVQAYRAQQTAGAMHYAEGFGPLQKAAQACYGLWFYVLESAWPATLSPAHALDLRLDPSRPIFVAAMVATAAAAAAWIALVARRRLPAVTTALAVYVVVVSPVLGLTQSGIQLVADRYAHLATMPFAILAAAGVARLGASPAARRAVAAAALAAIALLGWRANAYARAWHDTRTLFEHAVAVHPDNWFAWAQLGAVHREAGRLDEAMECFDRAIAGDPANHKAYEDRAPARFERGDVAGALADCDRAIELNPRCPDPLVNRGAIRSRQGDTAAARADFERALAIDPTNATAWMNLGAARQNLGDLDGARAAYARCVEHASPESPLLADAQRRLAALGGRPGARRP
jgi:tetratricopeptide (TPR) repeat protein